MNRMNVERISIDTNILIYAIDADAGNRHKMAIKVLERAITCDCLLTLQVLSEFFNVLTRKNQVSVHDATKHVEAFMEIFPVVAAKQDTLKQAIRMVSEHSFSFWDAMLFATAEEGDVNILLSEDFQHGRLVRNMRVVNPFVPNDYWNL